MLLNIFRSQTSHLPCTRTNKAGARSASRIHRRRRLTRWKLLFTGCDQATTTTHRDFDLQRCSALSPIFNEPQLAVLNGTKSSVLIPHHLYQGSHVVRISSCLACFSSQWAADTSTEVTGTGENKGYEECRVESMRSTLRRAKVKAYEN